MLPAMDPAGAARTLDSMDPLVAAKVLASMDLDRRSRCWLRWIGTGPAGLLAAMDRERAGRDADNDISGPPPDRPQNLA